MPQAPGQMGGCFNSAPLHCQQLAESVMGQKMPGINRQDARVQCFRRLDMALAKLEVSQLTATGQRDR